MAHAMARGGLGKIMDYPTRQTGRVFFISRRNYDRAIQLEHPCCSKSSYYLTAMAILADRTKIQRRNFLSIRGQSRNHSLLHDIPRKTFT